MALAKSSVLTGGITAAQRAALFAAGAARGLSIDDIRALTPAGSISMLSRAQASDLLDRMNSGTAYAHPRPVRRGPRRPKGVYRVRTPTQLAKIEALRVQLGWTAEGLAGWLSERHYVDGRPMTRIDSSADGVAVIELLKGVLKRTEAAQARANEQRSPGDGRREEPADSHAESAVRGA